LCSSLHSPVTSSVLDPNILLITLFSNTLSLCSSLNVRDQVSHPHKTKGSVTLSKIQNPRQWTLSLNQLYPSHGTNSGHFCDYIYEFRSFPSTVRLERCKSILLLVLCLRCSRLLLYSTSGVGR
jgi:hypothetical protein